MTLRDNDSMSIQILDVNQKIQEIHKVITSSFQTVADEFGITRENAPVFPAFIPQSDIEDMAQRGATFFGLMVDNAIAGVVAIEHLHDDLYALERLAVSPNYRHLGGGMKLMRYAFEEVGKRGGKEISIAVVDSNTRLKNWYIAYGFKIYKTKAIENLPFLVTFMKKQV